MGLAGEWNELEIQQGATFELPFEFTEEDEDGIEQPIDVSGTWRFQVRATPSTANPPIVDLTTANGGIVIDAPIGEVTLKMTAAATALLVAPFEGVYDLEWQVGTTVERVMEGKAIISPEVTR